MRKLAVVFAVLVLLPVPAAATPGGGDDRAAPGARLDLYDVIADAGTDAELRAEGYDIASRQDAPGPGRITMQMVLTRDEADLLRRRRGVDVGLRRSADGLTTAEAAARDASDGHEVWRRWAGQGGLKAEMQTLARTYDEVTELVTIGESVRGEPITALRVTADADRVADGTRPAVLYVSAQHAREWIGPEVNRRLLRYVLTNYGTDADVTRLVDTTELWFVLVANPDGYDRTFEDGQRLWRKNLRDNDGDGQITTHDGVDLDHNFPTRWGYDNEGSSPDPASAIYRGTGPASEPETQALDGLLSSLDFAFLVNYRAATESIRYGVGWQVDTPVPDDAVSVALAGTDDAPAIDGLAPGRAAERHIGNGMTTDHAHTAYGTVSFTVDLAACQTAADYFDDDEFGATYCRDAGRSVFEFPDSERLVRFEFTRNLDFALAVAGSADDPAYPESPVGRPAPAFVVDRFEAGYGTPQEVAVWTRRQYRDVRLHYSVDGGPTRRSKVAPWDGGERYGDTGDVWYAEYRAAVRGLSAGDTVEVWFTATAPGGPGASPGGGDRGGSAVGVTVESEHFTFTVEAASGADVLVVADTSPGTSLGGTGARAHLDYYTSALEANGYTWDLYDVGVTGPAPHPLGVLGHYDAVIWYTGDKLVTDYQGGLRTTALAHEVTMAMRDYLNEGGKVLATGKNHGFEEFFPLGYDGSADQTAPCTAGGCRQLSNDTYQYYFGGYIRVRRGGLDADRSARDVAGVSTPYRGETWGLDGGDSADNQGAPGAADAGTASWLVTSSVLPVDEFPQFESWRSSTWRSAGRTAFEPVTGEWQATTGHHDRAYRRLATTVDLTRATTASLDFAASYRMETDWDYFFVEVRTAGRDDWTTLRDENGHTSRGTGRSCAAGWAAQLHPHLNAYQTATSDGGCSPTGTTGAWHATTGVSDGVEDWSVDLSAYAGRKVEVALSYVTDWATGDLGVFVDDVAVNVDGGTVANTSFERGLGSWETGGTPLGSAADTGQWERGGVLYEVGAAVTTPDTILLGFGFEGIETAAQREEVMRRSMEYLLAGR